MRGVCGRALKLPSVGEGCAVNEPLITGCQPDSRDSTVRDERGVCENVGYGRGYTGTYRGNADTAKPLPKVARVVFLPDKPGGKQRTQTSPYRPGSARSTRNPNSAPDDRTHQHAPPNPSPRRSGLGRDPAPTAPPQAPPPIQPPSRPNGRSCRRNRENAGAVRIPKPELPGADRTESTPFCWGNRRLAAPRAGAASGDRSSYGALPEPGQLRNLTQNRCFSIHWRKAKWIMRQMSLRRDQAMAFGNLGEERVTQA
jgi:hypothetical protein